MKNNKIANFVKTHKTDLLFGTGFVVAIGIYAVALKTMTDNYADYLEGLSNETMMKADEIVRLVQDSDLAK